MANIEEIIKNIENKSGYRMSDDDMKRGIEYAKTKPFKLNPYLPLTIALWIEQLKYYIDNDDKDSYDEKVKSITSKGFGFIVSIMEKNYDHPNFKQNI